MTERDIKNIIRLEIQSILMDIVKGIDKRVVGELEADQDQTKAMIDSVRAAVTAAESKSMRIKHDINNSNDLPQSRQGDSGN